MNKKNNMQKGIYNWVEELIFAIVVVIFLFSFVFKVVAVSGTSMEPNFYSGDRLIVSCINFDYEAGDVVVISEVLGDPIIKRIIATEGQEVDIDKELGIVYVDGVAVDETEYGLENGITTETFHSLSETEFPLIVPENCVFVLGDNRAVSNDSRYEYDEDLVDDDKSGAGLIDERNIIGKAVFRFLPVDSIGIID